MNDLNKSITKHEIKAELLSDLSAINIDDIKGLITEMLMMLGLASLVILAEWIVWFYGSSFKPLAASKFTFAFLSFINYAYVSFLTC